MMNIFVVHSGQTVHGAFLLESEARKFAASLRDERVSVSTCPLYQGKQELQCEEAEIGNVSSSLAGRFGGFRGG